MFRFLWYGQHVIYFMFYLMNMVIVDPLYAIGITIYCAVATYVTSQSTGKIQFIMFQSS